MFKANRIVNMSNINVSGLNKGIGRGSQNNAVLKYRSFATHLLVGAVCFYLGIGVGVRVELIDCEKECEKQEETLERSLEENLPLQGNMLSRKACDERIESICAAGKKGGGGSDGKDEGKRFPNNLSYFATGVSLRAVFFVIVI